MHTHILRVSNKYGSASDVHTHILRFPNINMVGKPAKVQNNIWSEHNKNQICSRTKLEHMNA